MSLSTPYFNHQLRMQNLVIFDIVGLHRRTIDCHHSLITDQKGRFTPKKDVLSHSSITSRQQTDQHATFIQGSPQIRSKCSTYNRSKLSDVHQPRLFMSSTLLRHFWTYLSYSTNPAEQRPFQTPMLPHLSEQPSNDSHLLSQIDNLPGVASEPITELPTIRVTWLSSLHLLSILWSICWF